MPDIPGDSSTTATLSVGGSVTDTIEVQGDHDWFRLDLTAGQSVAVMLNGVGNNPLSDPYLRIRDSSGTVLFENDDGGPGLNSLIAFRATYTGTYYVDVAGWDDPDTTHVITGNYQVSVSNYTPPAAGTTAQIADQLVSGYWDGGIHHFDVSQSRTITVNLTGLAANAQDVARQALATWSQIIGVQFVESTTSGQIYFDDNQTGAATSGSWSNGITTSEHVNVGTAWLTQYGTAIGSYGYQTYLHEIGHALGLGHAGDYNTEANYPYDAKFANDSWAQSIMSYFSQTEAQTGFSRAYLGTPMLADILAMQRLYGLSTTTRTGDTTYGFNSNADNPAYNANSYPNIAYTVFDSGGNDTLNYSGFSAAQRIDLRDGTFSDINGRVGNVAIAFGTIIENAIGGSGADSITGNAADNILTGGLGRDVLTGGDGADIFRDTTAGLAGDTITDFSRNDRIQITDANPNGFSFAFSGNVMSFTGGSITFSNTLPGRMVLQSAASGVQLALLGGITATDFDGDGRSDILWRNDNGQFGNWLANANGSFAPNSAITAVSLDWRVAGTGDFNGDGKIDVLWRNDNGTVGDWLATGGGNFGVNNASLTQVATSWHVVGVGDFNGDGRDDILWRNDNGSLGDWLGTTSGGFAVNNSAALQVVPSSWHVVATGDFNGDGRDDILWRNDNGALGNWLGTANGGFVVNDGSAIRQVPTDWHVAGAGDFNGDGRDDILWRNDNGSIGTWLGTSGGGFVINDGGALQQMGTNYQVADVGDYNGDGRSDILWRDSSGSIVEWTSNSGGASFSANGFVSYSVPNSWHVQSPDIFLV